MLVPNPQGLHSSYGCSWRQDQESRVGPLLACCTQQKEGRKIPLGSYFMGSPSPYPSYPLITAKLALSGPTPPSLPGRASAALLGGVPRPELLGSYGAAGPGRPDLVKGPPKKNALAEAQGCLNGTPGPGAGRDRMGTWECQYTRPSGGRGYWQLGRHLWPFGFIPPG